MTVDVVAPFGSGVASMIVIVLLRWLKMKEKGDRENEGKRKKDRVGPLIYMESLLTHLT